MQLRGSVRLPSTEDYWSAPVSHCSQGDLYLNVPFGYAGLARVEDKTEGTRQRGATSEALQVLVPHFGPGIVTNYTCGFMAQPPGTRGYGHNFRSVAPLLGFAAALAEGTLTAPELATVKGLGRASGYMYLPMPDAPSKGSDESDRDALLLLYRPSLVHQSVLDQCERPARLSERAQAILVSLLVQQVSPSLPSPDLWRDDYALDRSDGWMPQEAVAD